MGPLRCAPSSALSSTSCVCSSSASTGALDTLLVVALLLPSTACRSLRLYALTPRLSSAPTAAAFCCC